MNMVKCGRTGSTFSLTLLKSRAGGHTKRGSIPESNLEYYEKEVCSTYAEEERIWKTGTDKP